MSETRIKVVSPHWAGWSVTLRVSIDEFGRLKVACDA